MVAHTELDNSHPSDLQRRFDTLAKLEETELAGGHVDALMEQIDPTRDKTIAHHLENLNPDHQESRVISGFDRFGTLIRRNRKAAIRLLRRR
ncbi:MAG: hypothetical protein COU25_01260 [Candidatus Levybacteria bacterium CG10_big_fil_rev_8_21_14_0_10_35_13]|nr:MAG: hypothetical protein COU25_01260 [Candidatus Levybacteria bacterium CG10_big_fil_rev_8_21_14_0_10_35_13]